jgi:hypothetical protein
MKNVVLLVLGAGIGFALAHEFNKTAAGRDFFETARLKADEFRTALVEGYTAREDELRAGTYADR